MFVLEVVSLLTTVILIRDLVTGGRKYRLRVSDHIWLWFTVLFANFAEAVAEGRGKAQAEALRRQRTETQAKLLTGDGSQRDTGWCRAPTSRSATSCWSKPGT